jgi:hypothetical protein
MRSFFIFLAIALAPTASPGSAQPATALRGEDLRVATVGYRLALEGRTLCPDPYPLTGLLLRHLPEYDNKDQAAEIARHALDRGPGVLATVADSPAARAGLMAGDVLLALNGIAFPDPRVMAAERNATRRRAAIESTEAWLESALRRGPVSLRILRDGEMLSVELRGWVGCPARVRIANSNQANAFSNGTYVIITSRILKALRGDDELAVIIGHELAHNILHHNERLEAHALRVRASEEAADRLGLKLVAAAGYDVHAAIPMWRRLYARFGSGPPIFRTHPSLKARERLIAEVIAQLPNPRPGG